MQDDNNSEETQSTVSTGSKSNTTMIAGVAVVLALIVGGVFLVSKKTTPKEALVAETTTPIQAEATTSDATAEVQVINVEAGSYYYKPDVITVKQGQKVRLVLNSVDMMHNFNIDELGVKIPITQSGNTSQVEFTAETVGTFEYYCSVGNHRQMGQVGKLIVQ